MRLLLAEDESQMARALEIVLKHNNYTVDIVGNGIDALEYLISGNYDAAILDIMMPGMDGLEVLKRIRKNNISIPVLFLTAKSEIDDRVTGLDAGADDYLTKPFAMKELLARVRAMTRRKEETISSELKFGNVSLNTATYVLAVNENSIRLVGKEYQMMELLLKNPNVLISTEKFMDRIWGADSEAELSVVWVYISYLRRKLASLNADIIIKATRGCGYTLEEKE